MHGFADEDQVGYVKRAILRLFVCVWIVRNSLLAGSASGVAAKVPVKTFEKSLLETVAYRPGRTKRTHHTAS